MPKRDSIVSLIGSQFDIYIISKFKIITFTNLIVNFVKSLSFVSVIFS